MQTLDDQTADIEKLDESRQEARTLRQQAIDALSAAPYADRADWQIVNDGIERAQLLRALSIGKAKKNEETQNTSRQALTNALVAVTRSDLAAGKNNPIPILHAAYTLQALAELPGQALSTAALTCFYVVVRELTEVVEPTWVAGAARGSEYSRATAFITGECARALLALKTALDQTAEVADLLQEFVARKAVLDADGDGWSKTEIERQQSSLHVALAAHRHPIIVIPDDPSAAPGLLNAIEAALSAMPTAVAVAGKRELPPDLTTVKHMRGIAASNFAHAANVIAWDALDRLRNTLLSTPGATSSLKNRLENGAKLILDLLRQIEPFAESIIDREIAAASQYLSVPVDGAELVFAANLLGLVSDWRRPKIRAAYQVLYTLLSSNGRLLGLRPFDLNERGYRLQAATLEVTRRLADLIAHLDVEPEPEFVTRLMLPLEYTRVRDAGWTVDPPLRESKSLWWMTAIAAGTLDSVVKMLDQTINKRILRHFHVRRPETLKVTLDEAFYPDYGVAPLFGETRKSVAFDLLQLSKHAGNGPPDKDPMFSMILFGPPGTGKTTLVEAVAKSAKVPLVEVTPSDILVGGVEGIERRARLVFRALSKLTNVVILFDEFEQILRKRDERPGRRPTSVVEFLTPGMLPKLKALYDASKDGRVSYVLATNLLNTIDDAVRRNGRFDRRCGVFPPDALSRLGRLRDQFRSHLRGQTRLKVDDPDARRRLVEIASGTAGSPMSTIGKRGWFTSPEDSDPKKEAFGYIYGNLTKAPTCEREATFDKVKAKAESESNERYWGPWQKIWDVDEAFRPPTNPVSNAEWKALIEKIDKSFEKA